jgi:hypothetical protein
MIVKIQFDTDTISKSECTEAIEFMMKVRNGAVLLHA